MIMNSIAILKDLIGGRSGCAKSVKVGKAKAAALIHLLRSADWVPDALKVRLLC